MGNGPRPEALATAVLVAFVLGAPWIFGGTPPAVARALALAALAAASALGSVAAVRGGWRVSCAPVRPPVALLGLGALQLVPAPTWMHRVLAPGSLEVWHPLEPTAAQVLGNGPRPVSVDPGATAAWLVWTTALVALSLVAAPVLSRPRIARAVAWTVVAGGAAVAAFGVVAKTLYGPLLYGRIVVPTISPFGPFVSKNHFAGYVEMGALVALGLAVGLADRERRSRAALSWTESPRAWRVVAAYAAALAMGLGVLASLSRGGAVSLVAGGLAFAAIRVCLGLGRRAPVRAAGLVAGAVLVLGLAGAAVLPPQARARLSTLTTAGSDDAGAFRLGVWRDALALSARSPLMGYGLGSFASAFPRYKTRSGELRVEHAENDYVEMLSEGGLLGLLLALLAAGLAVRFALLGLLRQEDRLLRGIGAGALAGLAALLVHSLFDFNLRIPSNAALFALLAALALGASGDSGRSLGRWPSRVACLALLGVLALGFAWRPKAALPAAWDGVRGAHTIADPAARALRLARVDEALRPWLNGHPADAEAWFLLGWSRVLAGHSDGLELARHGVSLDPERAALAAQLRRLEARSR